MIEECLAGSNEFGVVLIERGSEVGGGDVRFDVGTVASILRAGKLEDGRWVLVTAGTERIRVREWLDDDPYPRADVERVTEPAAAVASGGARRRRSPAAPGARPARPSSAIRPPAWTWTLADDPVRASFEAAALATVGPLDAQGLLELDDAGAPAGARGAAPRRGDAGARVPPRRRRVVVVMSPSVTAGRPTLQGVEPPSTRRPPIRPTAPSAIATSWPSRTRSGSSPTSRRSSAATVRPALDQHLTTWPPSASSLRHAKRRGAPPTPSTHRRSATCSSPLASATAHRSTAVLDASRVWVNGDEPSAGDATVLAPERRGGRAPARQRRVARTTQALAPRNTPSVVSCSASASRDRVERALLGVVVDAGERVARSSMCREGTPRTLGRREPATHEHRPCDLLQLHGVVARLRRGWRAPVSGSPKATGPGAPGGGSSTTGTIGRSASSGTRSQSLCSIVRQDVNASLPPGSSDRATFVNAATGSSKNITPNRLMARVDAVVEAIGLRVGARRTARSGLPGCRRESAPRRPWAPRGPRRPRCRRVPVVAAASVVAPQPAPDVEDR